MLPIVNYMKKGLRQLASGLAALLLCSLFIPAPALALNDAQQLVVETWRLVNQSYVDPSSFDRIHWKRLTTEGSRADDRNQRAGLQRHRDHA